MTTKTTAATMTAGYVEDYKNSRNAQTARWAAEINEDINRQALADGVIAEPHPWFLPRRLKCSVCRRWFEAAMPEDMEGACCSCEHCGASLLG